MPSTPYLVGPNGVTVYLPGRPHDPVTVVNDGPDVVYLADDDIPHPPSAGHPLRAQSTIIWDKDRALFLACDTSSTVVVTANAGQVFDASAIAGQIIDQGLGSSIAQQIALQGVPQIDAAQSLDFVTFLTAGDGSGGGGGGTSGGGGGGGTSGSGGGTGSTGTPSGFVPGASGTAVANGGFNAWLTSHDLGAAATWADGSVADQTSGGAIGSGEEFGSWNGILNLALGGIFSGDSWSAAASGAYDSRWSAAISAAKSKWGSRTPANLHLRFAHEFNGSFSSWAVSNGDTANFRAAFVRWANLQRSIFPGSKVCWSPNYGTSSMSNIADAWPGDAYVDIVGPDWYNDYGSPHQHAVSAQDFTDNLGYSPGGNPQGLGAWLSFAAAHGKPMCLPEFGNPAVDTGGGAGGGEAPGWATAIIQWLKANGGSGSGQIWYAVYFNISSGYPAKFSIFGDGAQQPNTASVFQAAW